MQRARQDLPAVLRRLGLLALLVAYRLDPLFSWVVGVPDRQLGETLLTVLMLVTLLAGGLTAAALTRMRERVAGLRARVSGQSVPVITTAWDRLIDRLVPEPVIINSFPRASLTTEFMELTGTQRGWIRIPAWPERQLIGRETRRLTRRDVALASAITNAEPGFNRIIKQTERVGCGFRNMIDYQRRILTRIAVTPTTMVSSMNEAVPAQTRRAALPELGTPTKSDQSTAGTSLEPRRSRRREDRGSTVRLVDDEFSRRPGVQ